MSITGTMSVSLSTLIRGKKKTCCSVNCSSGPCPLYSLSSLLTGIRAVLATYASGAMCCRHSGHYLQVGKVDTILLAELVVLLLSAEAILCSPSTLIPAAMRGGCWLHLLT